MGEAVKRFSLKALDAAEASASAGEWVIPKIGGRVKVVPLKDRECQQKFEREREKIRRRESVKKGVDLPPSLDGEAFARAIVGTYVVEWEGFDGPDDQPLPLTEDNFQNIASRTSLFEDVFAVISLRKEEHKERIESNLGNS